MRSIISLLVLSLFVVACSPQAMTGKANMSPPDVEEKQVYVVAIPQTVLDQHPTAIEVINGILIENENSVRAFMQTHSNGKFNLATETYLVEQPWPNMISVINDLDDTVNWTTKKGIIIVYDGSCDDQDRGGGGHGVQEFNSDDGLVHLGAVRVADCSIFNATEDRTRYVILHELSHSLITTGHANVVQSIAYDPFGDYRANPHKAKLVCSIPFNSNDPEIRSFTPQRGCPVGEYGDPFDILGGAMTPYTTYSMPEKQRAGFISETSTNTLKLRKRGTYQATVYPHNAIDLEEYLVHVKIMKGRYGFYSIEYRTQLEPLFPANVSKILIRYAFTEGGDNFLIAALSPGEIYNNPTDNFSVEFREVQGRNPMKAHLEIQLR